MKGKQVPQPSAAAVPRVEEGGSLFRGKLGHSFPTL